MRTFTALFVCFPVIAVLASGSDDETGYFLPEGSRAIVTLDFENKNSWMEFHLCSTEVCSGMNIRAFSTDMSLAYEAEVHEDFNGLLGTRHHQTYDLRQNWSSFSGDTYVFEVEHRPGRLAVWLKGHPDKAAWVPTEADQFVQELKVWPSELLVQISSAEFKDNGAFGATSTSLPEGRRVDVMVNFKASHNGIEFHQCNSHVCSGLLVGAYYRNMSLAYEAKIDEDSTGLQGTRHHQTYNLRNKNNWSPFLEGTYVFEAEHRAGQLAVWLKGHPDEAAWVPIEAGRFVHNLKVWPLNRAKSSSVQVKIKASSAEPTPGSSAKPDSSGGQGELNTELVEAIFGNGAEPESPSNSAESTTSGPSTIVEEHIQDIFGNVDEHGGSVNSTASLNKQPSCGRAVAGPASLVQNGEKTPIETVPWHAGIFTEKGGNYKNVCGGSLVSPCVVVTAAHCIAGSKMYVALGKYLSGWDSESGRNVHKTQVKKITTHPYYKGYPTKLAYDIAVLELEQCSPINSKISTVCMDKNIQPVSSADIKVAGWGNETFVMTELESVTLTQLNFPDCLESMSNNGPQVAYVTHDKFCATRREGVPQSGLQMGDSGGAALVKKDGSWYMTGVVSSRLQDKSKEDYFVFTKVSEYVDWIQKFM